MRLLKEGFETNSKLKALLRDPTIMTALDDGKFKVIYDILAGDYCSNTMTRDFTELLLKLGDNPLESMKYVPKKFLYSSNISEFKIPSHVTSILIHAFEDCEHLTNIDFSSSTKLERIDSWAFEGCTSLTSVDLSSCKNLDEIGWEAFGDCSNLEHINFPASLRYIRGFAFSGCTELVSVNFTNCTNLNMIGACAFNSCENLIEVDLSRCTNLKTVDGSAFSNCGNLTTVIFPSSLTTLGSDIFRWCNSLKTIKIPKKFANRTDWQQGLSSTVNIEYY